MSTLSDLANEVQKAVYGKDLRRTVANFIEYVPRARSGTYTNLEEKVSNVRSSQLYTSVVGNISAAFYIIGTVLDDSDIKNAANDLVDLGIGHPLKVAILEIIDLIISDIGGATYRITINGASNCTIENWDTTVESGSSYNNRFTAYNGWKFQSVSVTMGDVPVQATVTDRSATVYIGSVTGNITITVAMVQDQPGPTPTEKTETVTITPTAITPSNTNSVYTPLEISFSTITGTELECIIITTDESGPAVQEIKSMRLQKENGVWKAVSCVTMLQVENNKNVSIVSTASGFKTDYIGLDEGKYNLGLGINRAASGVQDQNRAAVLGLHTYTITGYNYIPST